MKDHSEKVFVLTFWLALIAAVALGWFINVLADRTINETVTKAVASK